MESANVRAISIEAAIGDRPDRWEAGATRRVDLPALRDRRQCREGVAVGRAARFLRVQLLEGWDEFGCVYSIRVTGKRMG